MNRKDLKRSGPVTAHTPFDFGGANVFAVQAGVPFSEAMDAMALLLSTADETAFVAAKAGNDGDAAGAVWAVEHLLQLPCGDAVAVGKIIGGKGMDVIDAHLERHTYLHVMHAHRNGVRTEGKVAILVNSTAECERDETVADQIN